MKNDPKSQLVMTAKEESFLRELDDICTDAVAIVSEPTNRFSQDPALLEMMKAKIADTIADNVANGFKAQARREIDRHRREEGREHRNAQERLDYAAQAAAAGREVRPYTNNPTPELKKAQSVASTAKHRANLTPVEKAAMQAANAARMKAKRASRTPEQVEADKQKRRAGPRTK